MYNVNGWRCKRACYYRWLSHIYWLAPHVNTNVIIMKKMFFFCLYAQHKFLYSHESSPTFAFSFINIEIKKTVFFITAYVKLRSTSHLFNASITVEQKIHSSVEAYVTRNRIEIVYVTIVWFLIMKNWWLIKMIKITSLVTSGSV